MTHTADASAPPLRAGVIGQGFMGRTHVLAYLAAERAGLPCRLVAVCDRDPEKRLGRAARSGNLDVSGGQDPLFDPAVVRGHEQPSQLIADPTIDLISICTPTDTHVELALTALGAGKHVLIEKPVAIDAPSVRRVAEAARAGAAGPRPAVCMPGMCMRFWEGWTWLKARIEDGSLGRVRSAVFRRLGHMPTWAPDFYADYSRSGGALADLHIHDTDFILWCFGRPAAVTCTGSLHHVSTLYRYPPGNRSLVEGAHITAEGGWDHDESFGFRMRYTVVFERGTADFDLRRDPQLLLHRAGTTESIPIGPLNAYEAEIRCFVSVAAALACGRAASLAFPTIEDALAAAEVIDAERESLLSGRSVSL